MENTQEDITGTPGDLKETAITKVAKGENWGVTVRMRTYENQPVTDLTGYNPYIAWARTPGDDTLALFELADEEVTVLNDGDGGVKFAFAASDMSFAQPKTLVVGDVWLEPAGGGEDGSILQARINLTLKSSTKKEDVTAPPPTDGIGAMEIGSTFEVAA